MDFSFQAALIGHATEAKSKLFKIIVGESKAGSSSTSEVTLKERMLKHGDRVYMAQFINIPGHPRFLRHAAFYCAGCSALIYSYDSSILGSLHDLRDWISTTLQDHGEDTVKLLVDLQSKNEGKDTARSAEATKFAAKYDMRFLRVNVETGHGVTKLLDEMVAAVAQTIPTPINPSKMIGGNVKICSKLLEDPTFKSAIAGDKEG
mmetsp:Transcript_19641/g.27411  ORF Transcript_19641/g.27411 Transcript_19641/m.27411 type:complete len:205 (-) Transcript_19641:123-737(-)|eukprot:CAMPEP_0184489816 /NCGR_PEP_ID=MMETSP0113_2-20130426/16439_1 /TAXON_ID=91329 /ORGANISM="Norrisiella sphaerica, Strain BC52" /LENGTH=204 /DNA_ID=CAMNT_0026873447 /DNA_START=28 /DNA_END=642 /DNA_ORIENTATION=-